jgi:Ferritin-like
MDALLEIFFLPPMAVARLGSGPTPLDSFCWAENPAPHAQSDTVIMPTVSLTVADDGSVTPHLPSSIVFKDENGRIRPVAPFFELWAKLQCSDGEIREKPFTLGMMADFNLSLGDIRYEIVSANRKAARRAQYAPAAFIARLSVAGNDHCRHELRGGSPHTSGQEPLVPVGKYIPLGHFQVMRPVGGTACVNNQQIDLGILRVRFTPPKGIIYGPPEATSAPAPAVQPGQFEAPQAEYGRIHEIVAPANRILSGKTPWSTYIMLTGRFEDPQPQDGYDGANVGNHQSWGCVDDTSDSLIIATLAHGGRAYRAAARVFTSPPDFAPDRRPIFSIVDDIADREELPYKGNANQNRPLDPDNAESVVDTMDEVLDLFQRAFETASLFNLDALRARALLENKVRFSLHSGFPGDDVPKAGKESMTAADTPYINKLPTLAPLNPPSIFTRGSIDNQLPYTAAVPFIHAPLQDRAVLIDLLRRAGENIKKLVRPPFGKISELPRWPAEDANEQFRDPRVFRDQLHDMRMPPYMRDAARQPLSITRRQHRELVALIDYLQKHPKVEPPPKPRPGKIFPRNLTARARKAEEKVHINPTNSRLESGVANCFPGLEFDVRTLETRFFPGLLFRFITVPLQAEVGTIADQQGVRLLYIDYLLDPMLPETSEEKWVQELLTKYDANSEFASAIAASDSRWYLDWIEQGPHRLSMSDAQGAYYSCETAWRFIRGLEPEGELRIGLVRRDAPSPKPHYELTGRRRRYVNAAGLYDEAYRPGELTESMCNPWSHDFRDCACHYWASNRPDVVACELPADPSSGANPTLLKHDRYRPTRVTTYVDWLRARGPASTVSAFGTIAQNRPFQIDHYEINHIWEQLPFVLEGREIEREYRPPVPISSVPYSNDEELIDALENKLAGLELTLALEYLYALFSLRDPSHPGEVDRVRWPELAEELTAIREFVRLVAVGEMAHLRWANQMLWELDRHGHHPGGWHYRPVAEPGRDIPTVKERRSLRPLDAGTLANFIEIERPTGAVTRAYARCVATLQDEKKYPRSVYELAMRIDGEGGDHYEKFLNVQRILRRYDGADGTPPYLREVKLGRPDQPECARALKLFKKVKANIKAGYKAEARQDFPEAQRHISTARRTMLALQDEAEKLAREQQIGVPFWHD